MTAAVTAPAPAAPKRPVNPAAARPSTPEAALASGVTSRPRASAPAVIPLYKRMSFRQTIIPPLLTLGVLLPVFGLLPLVSNEESPWSAISKWIAYTALAMGIIMLALGIVNMFLVKQELADSPKG